MDLFLVFVEEGVQAPSAASRRRNAAREAAAAWKATRPAVARGRTGEAADGRSRQPGGRDGEMTTSPRGRYAM